MSTKILLIACIILLGFSLLLNLHYMGRWSGELRTQYQMGFDDGKSTAIEYWEAEFDRIRAENLRKFIQAQLARVNAADQYITMMESYSADGLGWRTGRSNAP